MNKPYRVTVTWKGAKYVFDALVKHAPGRLKFINPKGDHRQPTELISNPLLNVATWVFSTEDHEWETACEEDERQAMIWTDASQFFKSFVKWCIKDQEDTANCPSYIHISLYRDDIEKPEREFVIDWNNDVDALGGTTINKAVEVNANTGAITLDGALLKAKLDDVTKRRRTGGLSLKGAEIFSQ